MNNCSICKKQFKESELLQSKQDDYYCKECFKFEYCNEKQFKAKKKMLANKCEGDSGRTKPKKMFTLHELSMIKEQKGNKYGRFTSKRPLQCPHLDCKRYISIFDLTTHFQHEHIDVKTNQTTLDTRNPLTFYPKDIHYGMKQCLLLLNVIPNIDDTNNDISVNQPEKPSLPLSIAVLASRLSPSHLDNNSNDSVGDDDGMIVGHNDKIIIWTASNIITSYSYTVAVSTVTDDIRVKYYGPIRQLGSSSKELCLEGQGLILSHYHFLGMSEQGLKPLQVDVIIHSED